MPDRDEARASDPMAHPTWRRALAWLALAIAGVVVLGYLAAHLPRKPLGLVGLAFAVVAIWGMLWLAHELRLNRTASVLAASTGLVLAGQAGIAWESHRVFANAVHAYWGDGDPRVGMLDRMKRSGARPEDLAAMKALIVERRQALAARASFSAWLRHRLSQVRPFDAASPWPAMIWVAEVLGGTTAGAWIGGRLARWTATAPSMHAADDHHPTAP